MRLKHGLLNQAAVLICIFGCSIDAVAGDIEAHLDWAGLHVVSFPMDGGIARVHVRSGDRVSKGAKLVELNTEPIDISISRYEAEVAAGKPAQADARRDFEHAQSLYEQTVLSDVELQRARHAFEKASAELAAARARLDFARWQKRQAHVTAPWDARIIERNVEPGQMLVAEQRSMPALLLARADLMTVRAWLPLSVVQALETGQQLTVLVGNRPYTATLAAIGMQAGSGDNAASYRVEAVFEVGPDNVYMAGQAAVIRLP